MNPATVFLRWPCAATLLALLLAPGTSHADEAGDESTPRLVGPVLLGPGAATFPAASYRVAFVDGGTRASVELTVQVRSTEEVVLGFAGKHVSGLTATLDGAQVPLEYTIAPLPVPGGPFDTQLLVRLPPSPSGLHTVVLVARCETRFEERDPRLTRPQASFLLNASLDGPRARTLTLDPASAADAQLAMRVETIAPQRPEAPLDGTTSATADGAALEGRVAADADLPLEIAAVEGDEPQPRNWAFGLGIGLALDWPHVERVNRNDGGEVLERWYQTMGFRSPGPRMWLSGFFRYAFDEQWLFTTGLEGDPLGALEIPLLFTWYPQDRPCGCENPILDYHFLFGLALQVFNDASPGDYGFDPRPFVRLGAGLRFYVLTFELAYEIAPPVGDWNGPNGLLEHKLLFTFPFTF